MLFNELQTLIDKTQWIDVGHGSFNNVQVSASELEIGRYKGYWVLKKAISQIEPIDLDISNKTRAVRKWNEINPDYPAFEAEEGWIAPYFGKIAASDDQISNKVIEIYQKTKNIICDAVMINNFLVYNEEVICVDVDQAFRRGSIASDNFNQGFEHRKYYTEYFKTLKKTKMEKTIEVIKTLIYLESKLTSDQIKSEHITPKLISYLHLFRVQEARISPPTMDMLFQIAQLESIRNEDITPHFLKVLHAVCYTNNKPITQDVIHTLVSDLPDMRKYIFDGKLSQLKRLIDYKTSLLHSTHMNNDTALHLATKCEQSEIACYLIDNNVNLNAKNKQGKTALDIALKNNCHSIAVMLIKAGAEITQTAERFQTHPVHIAAQNGLLEPLKKMILQNPDLIKAIDSLGHSPLSIAKRNGHEEIAELLCNQVTSKILPYISLFNRSGSNDTGTRLTKSTQFRPCA